MRIKLTRALAASGLGAGITALTITAAVGATLTTVGTATGNAYVVKAAGNVTVLTLALAPVNIPETPSVSTTNTALTSTKTAASLYVPTACVLLTATCAVNVQGLTASTRNTNGASGASVASADAATASLVFGLVNLSAVHAACKADKNGLTMASWLATTPALATLPIPPGTVPPDVSVPDTSTLPAPNTVVAVTAAGIVVGTLTLNEQVNTSTGTRNSGEVNAVHLQLPPGSLLSATGLDVIVGHAACSASAT